MCECKGLTLGITRKYSMVAIGAIVSNENVRRRETSPSTCLTISFSIYGVAHEYVTASPYVRRLLVSGLIKVDISKAVRACEASWQQRFPTY